MKINKKTIQALKMKDENAFDHIYYAYHKLVYHIIYDMVHDALLTEELVSDAFVKMYQSIDSFNEDNNFKYWFLQIAKNITKNKIKSLSREKYILSETLVHMHKDTINFEYDQFMNDLHLYLNAEEIDIINMHILYGYSFKDIAEELGVSVSSISNKYYRALNKLKEIL